MKVFHRHYHALLILTALFSLLLVTELVALAAAIPVTWNLTGVSFVDGGGATGWFTYDASSITKITDWNITATFGDPMPLAPPHVNPETFTPAGPSSNAFSALNSTYTVFAQLGLGGQYALEFTTPVSLEGAAGPVPISTNPALVGDAGYRFGGVGGLSGSAYNIIGSSDGPIWGTNISGGNLTVPEGTSTLLYLGIGLVSMWGLRRTKFKSI